MTDPLRICIVTSDIVGPIRNGGIGTAYYNLAHALVRQGHRVTILYALGQYCENKTVGHWRREYARHGIDFVPLPSAKIEGHPSIRISYSVYRWLKNRRFDIVHCHEWRGIGFYTALAKQQGLCLDGAVLCVGAHSPTMWILEGMNELAKRESLEVDFMERQSVAKADVLWSPSEHMVQWMRREGWTLPAEIIVKPLILVDLARARAARAAAKSELVFFGRLETRKGIDLFCDALDRLVAAGTKMSRVTFLGKPTSVHGVPSEEYLRRRAEKWDFKWQVLGTLDRDAAMAYLRRKNRVAVMPSHVDNLPYTVLECLGSNIPFVAANVGGIPEMIRPQDRERVLFEMTAPKLAERLTTVLRRGLSPAEIKTAPADIVSDWLAWHERVALERREQPAAATLPDPKISVCITTHDRPRLLAAAINSIKKQDYPNLEVIVVDDGSKNPRSLLFLDSIEADFERRGWRIIRQTNKYLGAARNTAIAAATGDYLLFMDDDNLAVPDELRTFATAAVRSGADILTCFLSVFRSASPAPTAPPVFTWPFLGGAIGPGLMRNVFGDANALVRRDVFDRVGGFSEDFGITGEDWEFFARATLKGLRVDVVPEALVLYRQSPHGMLHTTSQHANYMRAIRPYLGLLPANLRPLVHLAHAEATPSGPDGASGDAGAAPPARLDHVQRAAVFGSGAAGRLALDLASKCGWSVPFLVDNNEAMWNQTAHGKPVKKPDTLKREHVDLVIVASLAGKPAISSQLEAMGLESGTDFVHFLDPVRVGPFTTQVHL